MKSCKTNESGRLIKKRFMAGECALDAIKEFLEEQAKQGFKLIRVEGSNYWFEEIEPCEIKYSVEIFNKASNYDTIPAKTTEEFIEFCREAGWNYISSRGKLLFFSSTKEDVIPITEPKEKLKTLFKSCFLPQFFSMFTTPLIVVLVPMLLMCFTDIYSAAECFIDNLSLYSYMIYGIVSLAIFFSIKISIFYFSNKKRVDNGLDLVFFSKKKEDIFNVLYYILSLIVLAIFFLDLFDAGFGMIFGVFVIVSIVGMVILLRVILNKSKLSRTGNKVVTVGVGVAGAGVMIVGVAIFLVVSVIFGIPMSKNEKRIKYYDKEEKSVSYMTLGTDELPLSLTDLGKKDKKTKYIDSTCSVNSSAFGKKYECDEYQYDKKTEECGESLSYEILSTKWKFIKDSYINHIVSDEIFYDCVEEDKEEATKWKAKKFYKLKELEADKDYYFMVVYDDTVLYFSTYYEDYIKNNIDVIYDKLVENRGNN